MPACKPNSVYPRRRRLDRRAAGSTIIYLWATVTGRLKRPTRAATPEAGVSTGRRIRPEAGAALLGLAPRGVCQAACVAAGAGALLPHRCTLACACQKPLPVWQAIGGLFSVALLPSFPRSRASGKRLPVRKHDARWRSDFPHRRHAGSKCPQQASGAMRRPARQMDCRFSTRDWRLDAYEEAITNLQSPVFNSHRVTVTSPRAMKASP